MNIFKFKSVKIMFGFLLVFFMLNSSYAVGWHTASEILDGVFSGDYSFAGDVDFTGASVIGLDEGVWNVTGNDTFYEIGNVGIGTVPSSSYMLDVNGTINSRGIVVADSVLSHISADGAFYRYGGQAYITVDDNFYIRDTVSTGLINLRPDGDVYFNNGGEVGIGTTNPTYKLDVSGTIRSTSTVTAVNFECTNCIDEGDIAQNQIDNSEIQDNSLTGSSIADDTLDFVDFQNTLDLDGSTIFQVGDSESLYIDLDGNGDFIIRDANANHHIFFDNGDVRLGNNNEVYVDTSTGRVGIGRAPGAKLDVAGQIKTDDYLIGNGAMQMLATNACLTAPTQAGWMAAYKRGGYSTCNARCAATGSAYYVNCRGMVSVRGYGLNQGANPTGFMSTGWCASTAYPGADEFYCCCSY